MEKLLNFLKDEEGATAVEYGVLVALIIAILVGVIATLGERIKKAFTTVAEAIAPA